MESSASLLQYPVPDVHENMLRLYKILSNRDANSSDLISAFQRNFIAMFRRVPVDG